MNTFIVDLKNQPGELARVTEAIAKNGIDISAFAGSADGARGTLILVPSDELATRHVLSEFGWSFRTVELVEASLAGQPGSLAEVTRRLADAGVNIEAAVPLSMTGSTLQVGFVTDDPVTAKQALGELVGAYIA